MYLIYILHFIFYSILITTNRLLGQEVDGDFHYELAKTGSNPDVHVVALVDRCPGYSSTMDDWSNSRLYYVNEGDYPDNTQSTYWVNATGSDEVNMADPKTLQWFIKTVQINFPSDNLYLSLWDHNWGWHSGWFQKDETSNKDTMDYPTLFETLSGDTSLSNIALLGYDACVASQIEVIHTWRPFASSFVGSQDYVGYGGVNYDSVISAIRSNPSITPQNLSIVVGKSMLTDPTDKCASSFDMNKHFDNIVASVDKLSLLFIKYLDAPYNIRSTLIGIRDSTPQTPHFPADEFHRDLYGVAMGASLQLTDYPDIVDASRDIMKYFNSSLVYNEVLPGAFSCKGGRGMTIYWTKSGDRPEAAYFQTSFGKATHWDEFLAIF